LPDGAYSYEEIGKKPLAVIELEKATIQRDVLYENIFTRRTNRLKYHPGKLRRRHAGQIDLFRKPNIINHPL
jgi:hypothetical protein